MKDRIHVSIEDAIAMLPKGKTVHTIRSGAMNILIGADWDRKHLIEVITELDNAELAGEEATKAQHGLVIFDAVGPVFIMVKK